MNLNPAEFIDAKGAATHIVRGCPCYREFGDSENTEKVCLNNDSVFPINSISIDPSFFQQLDSRPLLGEFQSDKESMCYLLMFLDRKDGFCYCVSQGQRIRINDKYVKASEIDSALQFVTSSQKSRDGVLCSDCLYKYIRTMGESSEDLLTDDERKEIIAAYVRNLANSIARELSGYNESIHSCKFKDHLPNYMNELNRSRSHWISMIRNLKKTGGSVDVIQLIESYSTLSRLESVFLFQVQTLQDEKEDASPLDVLQFMVGVSEKVMSINDEIRERTNELMSRDSIPDNIQEMLTQHIQKRRETEYRFSNFASVLNKIESNTAQ
ncbi:MAG: hypothetical protein ACXAAO_15145 [Candidatus Thorarchaeota archaeon]